MQRTPFVLLRSILFGFVLLAFVAPAGAQFKAGVQGTVKDPKGAVVPNAKVTVINQETGRTQETVTSDEGFYRITGLPPGKYTVTAEAPDFKRSEIKDVVVSAEDIRGVDFTLELGAITETVTVHGDALPTVQTENANITRAITTEEIQRLPTVGRDPYELLRLAPGVFGDAARSGTGGSVGFPNATGPGGSNTSIFQVENQPQISANGQRISANNFQIDGVSVNSLGFGGAAVVTPNEESVKEVRVISNSYSAEDGRNSGAQIKVVTRNGTNDFHGSGFFKYQDPSLNAFNKYGRLFDRTPVRVNNRFRQFGGSIGGPVVRNNLFFFFSYEGIRSNNSDVDGVFVETPEYRALVKSLRSGGKTAKVFSTAGIEPRIVKVLPGDCSPFGNDPNRCRVVSGGMDLGSPTGSLNNYVSLGNPTGGGFDGIPDIQKAVINSPNLVRGNQYNSRVDYTRGNDQFAVSTYFTNRNDVQSDRAGASRPIADLTFQPLNSAASVIWIRTLSSTLLNEARFNFTRFSFDQVESSSGTNFGIPRIEVEGLPFDRIRFGAPRAETTPGIFAQNTYDLRDTLSKQWANHAWKFGVEVRREQDINNLVGGARPLYSFVGLFNLANDTPIFESINASPQTGGPADAQRYFRTTDFALFAQDDWKFRPNLTFQVGLRYEYFSPLTERRGQLTNLSFGVIGLVDSFVTKVDQLTQPDKNNFAPRLGFAYSPTRFRDKFVVRGGLGLHYNRIPGVLFTNTRGNPPNFARFNICCGTALSDFGAPFACTISYDLGSSSSPFSYPVNPALGGGIDPVTGGVKGVVLDFGTKKCNLANIPVEIWGAAPNLRTGYVYTYSLEAEYSLPYHLVVTLGYQGSAGHKLIRLANQNFLFKPNPAFFATFFVQPDVNSSFNALNLRVTRRFAQGFEVIANYRYGKSIDTLSNEGPGAETNQTDPAHLATERGPSDYDAKHSVIISGLWDLPILRHRTDAWGKALGGWQINGILSAHTGFSWTPKTCRQRSVPITGADTICPTRPVAFLGGGLEPTNDNLIPPRTMFPGGGTLYFDISQRGPPGIGRNSFRGPRYVALDLSMVKRFGLPKIPGIAEGAGIEFRANFYNILNTLNLAPLRLFSPGTFVEDLNFGRADGGLAGRIIEFQAKFSF